MFTFTFTVRHETKEYVTSGNVSADVALQMLQQIVISEAVRRANDGNTGGATEEPGAATIQGEAGEGNPQHP